MDIYDCQVGVFIVARPSGSPQITHSRVTAIGKGPIIVCKLRLAVSNLGAFKKHNLFDTLR